ncbi:MAG: BON domain-containing protein [Gemmatimonadota bacterium]
MRLKRRKRPETATWAIVAGVALTGAAAAYALSRLVKSGPVQRRLDSRSLEKRVLQALLGDEITRSQGIDISAVGPGVIEVSGAVERADAARRVVDLIDAVPGVHAVLNRLEIPAVEERLQRNRKQRDGDGPRWYGGRVGIGKRRQSRETDPPQPDDSIAMRARSLQPNRDDVLTDVEEMEGTGVRIGVSRAGALTSDVAPRSPDPSSDEPGPPPAADRSEPRQPA